VSLSVILLLAVSALNALQTALDSAATWTMERTLPGSTRVLRSSGDVDCKIGRGIVWTVKEPFASSVEMTTNAMVFVDEDGRRVKTLDELPHYADIRRATDAFTAGNAKAFDGVFDLVEQTLPDGGWRLVLKPEISAMERLFTSVEVTGSRVPTNVVMRTSGGGVSVIRFRERPVVR